VLAGFAFAAGAAFGIDAVAVSDIVGMSAAWMLGAAAATGLGAAASGCAAKLCMQIRHSTGVPAAISIPNVNVEPQCGQASCVLELAMMPSSLPEMNLPTLFNLPGMRGKMPVDWNNFSTGWRVATFPRKE
jgi:hypothetical protein